MTHDRGLGRAFKKHRYMRRIYLICLLTCVSAQAAGLQKAVVEPANFQGYWIWHQPEASFDLNLKQRGLQLRGFHCAVVHDLMKSDCSETGEDEFTLTGAVEGRTAIVTFTSATSGERGKAKIIHQGKTLLWQITEMPKGGSYLPREAKMQRIFPR